MSAEKFRSGTSGEISGIRHTTRAVLYDAVLDVRDHITLQSQRLRAAARSAPQRRVLAVSIESAGRPSGTLEQARAELERSHHELRFMSRPAGAGGKFPNLNEVLEGNPPTEADWLIVVDDDVKLPGGFLDVFIFLAERFEFVLAQPAHRNRSHAAWRVTRRQAGSVARQTLFVEIGPVVAFHASTFAQLLPFVPLRFGWGLDAHWSAIARENRWRVGVIDATPIAHVVRRVAASYDHAAALAEADQFLASHPHVSSAEAQRTLAAHKHWR